MRTTTRRTRRTRLTGLAVAAVLVGLASPAAAIPAGDPNDPADPPERPDLRVTRLAVVESGSNWSVSYTVSNTGLATAGSSTVGFSGGATRSVPALAEGGSSSGSLLIPRSDCYVSMSATADRSRVVTESNEYNNTTTTLRVIPGCPPRYKVTAVSFKAVDESSLDWSGSDEPFWVFGSVANGGTAYSTRSGVFGDVDTGETRSMSSQCLFGCSGVGELAPSGMGLSIESWENDNGNVDEIFYDVADAFDDIGGLAPAFGAPQWTEKAGVAMTKAANFILDWYGDDLLGKAEFAYSPEFLGLKLPATGASFTDTRTLGGSSADATYQITLQVRRTV